MHQTTFTYNSTTSLLTAFDAGDSQTASLAYNTDRTLQSAMRGSGVAQAYAPQQAAGLVLPSTGVGTSGTPAVLFLTSNVNGATTDGLSQTSTFTADPRGLMLTSTDAAGNVTSFVRNADGQITQQTDPDPDGSGSLPAPVTTYTYDSYGNTTGMTHPDGSTESWTYDSTFHQLTSHTDQLGHVTCYTLTSNGQVATEPEK
ncbi:MAG: YD repeat-containing protein [Myxococcales bacterium]